MLWIPSSDAMPRTTVDLDASVLAELRRRAASKRKSIERSARALVERLAAGPDLVYLFWLTIMGYLRIIIHPVSGLDTSTRSALSDLGSGR